MFWALHLQKDWHARASAATSCPAPMMRKSPTHTNTYPSTLRSDSTLGSTTGAADHAEGPASDCVSLHSMPSCCTRAARKSPSRSMPHARGGTRNP
eukprot:9143379-Pyramimonas_sp.AAC.1